MQFFSPALRSLRFVVALLCFAALAACNRSVPPAERAAAKDKPAAEATFSVTAEMEHAQGVITGDDMRSSIATLSSDAFEGRGTASQGDELAMQFLEQQLKSIDTTTAYRPNFNCYAI